MQISDHENDFSLKPLIPFAICSNSGSLSQILVFTLTSIHKNQVYTPVVNQPIHNIDTSIISSLSLNNGNDSSSSLTFLGYKDSDEINSKIMWVYPRSSSLSV